MKVLLTGATGFLGHHLYTRLESSEHSVFCLLRDVNSNYPNSSVINKIDAENDFSCALDGIDCVIHAAARVHIMNDQSINKLESFREINTYGTANLARQAAKAGVKRFVFISSIKVNGESSILGKPFTYADKRKPEDFYGQSKSEAEEQLLALAAETGLEVVIIRPTLVYGAGVKANFASLMKLTCKGLPLPFGCIDSNKRSLVSVTNLVDLIKTCIVHPKAVNQVFLVSDDHDVSTSEMVKQMAKALDKSTLQLPVPTWCYQLVGKLTGKSDVINRLTGSLQVDIQHTKETLSWMPPQSLEDGFKETANYILEQQGKK
ncbi:UDP-glucose 4-epimerase family protein [Vibrio splendidus]